MEPKQQPTKNEELETIKTYIEDYLQTTSYYRPNKRYANKFICINPLHQEMRPSMSLDKKRYNLHCFSCNASYSIIDLVIKDYELGDQTQPLEARLKDKDTIKESINKIKELYNISGDRKPQERPQRQEQPKENLEELNKLGTLGQPTREYLKERGIIDNELIEKLGLKNRYGKAPDTKGYLMIPYNLKGTLEHLTERVISLGLNKDLKELPKELRYKHHGKMITYDPFNYLMANRERAIFITEGEIDTISFYQSIKELHKENRLPLNTGSIALGGINNSKDFINKLDILPNKEQLYFILALDNDERGQQTQKDLKNILEEKELNYCFFNYGTSKDANELLVRNKEAFKGFICETLENIKELTKKAHKEHQEALNKEIQADREAYINKNSVLGYLNTFNEHRANPVKPSRTYFEGLDKILNGGFREGLITIGAVSSLGKTSFILQLADQLAQSRQKDVYYFSLEMSQDELIAKSLNRLMYLEAKGQTQHIKTQTEILSSNPQYWSSESKTLFNLALEDFRSYGDHLFIKEGVSNFGVKDIESALREHILKTNRTPIVIIDYLQILASQDNHLSDKQKIDTNILALKQLSRDLHTTIIVVSSLNRASYGQDVSLASFKESGAIEYTSDVIIGLNYNLLDAERNELKEIRRNAQGLPEEEKGKLIEDFYKSVRAKNPRDIKMTILKNRQGEKDKDIALYFYPKFNMFTEQGQSLEIFKELLEHSKTKSQQEFIELPF